jgi:four helix bundle protein
VDEREFKARTKKLGLDVIRLVEALPKTRSADILGRQLLRAATSVGANYRAACRGKSSLDVIAKLAIVEEEADETLYWMELLLEANIAPSSAVRDLWASADSIVAMIVASIKTMRRRNPQSKAQVPAPAIQNPKPKIQNGQDGTR